MDGLQGGVESRPEILQQVARFPEYEFRRDGRSVNETKNLTAPVVPLVALRESPYNWTGVEDISNGQILHAWKDRAVRSPQCRRTWRPSRRPKIPRPPCERLHEEIGRESFHAAVLPQKSGVFRLGGDARLLATCNTDVEHTVNCQESWQSGIEPLDRYTELALAHDPPKYRLCRGDLVRLLEHHVSPTGEEGYSAEVLGAKGQKLAVVAVAVTSLEPFRDDGVLSVRARVPSFRGLGESSTLKAGF
jgi:hypothetical protein